MMNKSLACLAFGLLAFTLKGQDPKLDYAVAFTVASTFEQAPPVVAITVDHQGNSYTTGRFVGPTDFDPGDEVLNLETTESGDVFITKLGPRGDLIWAKQFFSDCIDVQQRSIEVDNIGYIYLTGTFSCSLDFDPGPDEVILIPTEGRNAFVAKLDPDGNFLWVKQFGSISTIPTGLTITNNSEVIVVGSFEGSVDFDPGPSEFNLGAEFLIRSSFVLKLSSNGDFVSAQGLYQQSGVGWYVDITSVKHTSDNDIVLVGRFRGTVDFDPTTGSYLMSSSVTPDAEDGFICSISAGDQFQWAGAITGFGRRVVTDVAINNTNELVITGWFEGSADLDPTSNSLTVFSNGSSDLFAVRLTQSGSFLWARTIVGVDVEIATAVEVDDSGNIIVLGNSTGTVDFDVNNGGYLIDSPSGGTWSFICKWDVTGNVSWVLPFGYLSIDLQTDPYGGVVVTGPYSFLIDLDPGPAEHFLPVPGGSYIWSLKEDRIQGSVWNDIVNDCDYSIPEPPLGERIIEVLPLGIIATTNSRGVWTVDSLPPGSYTARVDHNRGPWTSNCSIEQLFEVTNSNALTVVGPFGLTTTTPCAMPDVSIGAPQLRRCTGGQAVYLAACNQLGGTDILSASYVEVEFDPAIQVVSADLPYSTIGMNRYRIDTDDLYPGQCVNAVFVIAVDCATANFQTLCMTAELFPQMSCVFDTVPGVGDCATAWDGSNIKIDSYCVHDSVWFVLRNTAVLGEGDMSCFSNVRIFLDGELYGIDSVQLLGGGIQVFSFPGNGHTWRLEADQHPLHPGNSTPMAVEERCGYSDDPSRGFVIAQYMNDADPIIDTYCGMVTGSLDPNDKIGYPTGLSEEHFILPGQQLQYMIRFQNTGNDTAFTVIIRDTLDVSLDAFTVVPGVASHPYSFRMYGPRVIEWVFGDIQLPDSTTDLLGSNGFVTFRVDQVADLPNWTTIRNAAAIYFDFNEPVLTEPYIHTVHDMLDIVTSVTKAPQEPGAMKVRPNPTHDGYVVVDLSGLDPSGSITVFDAIGKHRYHQQLTPRTRSLPLDLSGLPSGLYFIQLRTPTNCESIRVVRN